jgi:glycosyltransferase involved in cell wall biosynthesis
VDSGIHGVYERRWGSRRLPGMTRRVLAFQPWDDGSHRAVRASIERHARFAWTHRCLPGRGPRWRLRHAALQFAAMLRDEPSSSLDEIDAIHATSMLSMSDLRATVPAVLRNRPFILSMHENQIAYPPGDGASDRDRDRDGHLAFTNLASIEAADRVVWNSRWNLTSFVEGMLGMLRHAPERIDRGWVDRLEAKSTVVPPPIEFAEIRAASPAVGDAGVLHNTGIGDSRADGRVIRVVWPHRWEHDKGVDELLQLADEAWTREQRGGPAIRWILLGQRFDVVPEAMVTLLSRHAARIEHAGDVSREAYLAWLYRADWVLSTARHEFFGMAVAEALVAGCLPWLPNRLSYPELVPPEVFGWNPWTVETPDLASEGELSRSTPGLIADRLAAAEAGVAVGRLEDVIEDAIRSGGD